MSIQPPSDIVLDVAQAADPVKSMAATQRLMRAASPDDPSVNFSNALAKASSAPLDNTASLKTQLGLMGAPTVAHQNGEDARTKAYKGLEALVFQNLFETTLPKDESLGSGMAGNVWRSMMAEQLGKQAAKMIDLGLFPKSATANAHDHHALKALPHKNFSQTSSAVAESDPVASSS